MLLNGWAPPYYPTISPSDVALAFRKHQLFEYEDYRRLASAGLAALAELVLEKRSIREFQNRDWLMQEIRRGSFATSDGATVVQALRQLARASGSSSSVQQARSFD